MIDPAETERCNLKANPSGQIQIDTNSHKQTLCTRRKGTVGPISVQIPPMNINMDYHTTDAEYDSEHSGWVEAWLDEHPEFFQSYMLRKGTRSMIDSWLVTHALPPGITATTLHNVDEEDLEEESDTHPGDGDSSGGSNSARKTTDNESASGATGIPIPTANINSTTGTGSKVIISNERHKIKKYCVQLQLRLGG